MAVPDNNDLLTIESFLSDFGEREWMSRAACKGMDTNLFFPERGDTHSVRLAKSVCAGCPVIEECGEYGKAERFGFWGGMGVRRRRNYPIR